MQWRPAGETGLCFNASSLDHSKVVWVFLVCGGFVCFNLSVCLWLCFKVPRVPVHTLAMVVPPQEPDRTPQENSPPLLGVVKG